MNKIALIVVTRNAKPWITKCLDSLRNQTVPDFDLYIVDNNSSDETCKIVLEKIPAAIIIRNNENLGFAKANNLALKKALERGAEYFVLLNQDTVVQNNFLEEGIKTLADKGIGVAAPKILYLENKKIWWIGSKVFHGKEIIFSKTFQIAEHIDKKKSDEGQFDFPHETAYVPGTALFTRRDVLEKIGLLDETFFMYSEDIDFSFRAKNKKYRLVCFPSTTVFHDTPFYSQKNKTLKNILFKYKNYFFGVVKIVLKYYTNKEKIYWFLKLPISLITTLIHEAM